MFFFFFSAYLSVTTTIASQMRRWQTKTDKATKKKKFNSTSAFSVINLNINKRSQSNKQTMLWIYICFSFELHKISRKFFLMRFDCEIVNVTFEICFVNNVIRLFCWSSLQCLKLTLAKSKKQKEKKQQLSHKANVTSMTWMKKEFTRWEIE